MAPQDARREMSEQQALAMLRQYSRVQWVMTVGSWLFAGVVLMLIRRWLLEDTWRASLIYSAVFAGVAMLVFLALEFRRVRRLPDEAGRWSRLEHAQVVTRQGNDVTLRGKRATVRVPVHGAWTLTEGDAVWVGPAVREGERIALVRSAAGPFGTPVYAASGPAERA